MKIQNLSYSRLRNAVLSGVAKRLASALNGFPREEARPAIEAFDAKATEFHESIRQITASSYSLDLKEIDPERDRLIRLLNRMVGDATKSRNDELKDAANRINVVLRAYGKPARMPIDQQTIVTQKLLRDLYANGNGAYLVKIPGAAEIVTQLEDLNDTFEDLYSARISSRVELEKALTQRLRDELIKSLLTAVEAVNATATLFPDEEINDVIKTANAIIDQAKINLANINKKPSASKGEEKEINE